MSEIVKYHNEMNEIKLSRFTASDLDMLMLLCARMKDHKTNELSFDFSELKSSLGLLGRADSEFLATVESMQKKLNSITCNIRTETKRITFTLFPTLETDLEKRKLTVSVNEKYAFLLNELGRNFTRFELQEFVHLESRYSKSLYRLLKQYRLSGWYEADAEELRGLLDCPQGYPNKEFMRVCVNPAVKELTALFPGLAVETLRGSGRGRPVRGYRFTFQADQAGNGGADQAAGKKKPGKPKKNRFDNFQGRSYTDEELAEIEKALLG